MKIVLASLVLTGLGLGSFGLMRGEPQAAACSQTCDASVTCLPNGNCLIECTRPDGSQCSVELACDGEACEVVDCSGPSSCETACKEK